MIGSKLDPNKKSQYLVDLKGAIQNFIDAFSTPNFDQAAAQLVESISLEHEFPLDILKLEQFQEVCINGLKSNDHLKSTSLVLTRISFRIPTFEKRLHDAILEAVIFSLSSGIVSLENTVFLFKLLANLTATMVEAEIDNIIQGISIPIYKAIRRRGLYKSDLILLKNIAPIMLPSDDPYRPKYAPGKNPYLNYLTFLTKIIRRDPESDTAYIAAWTCACMSRKRGQSFCQALMRINFFRYINAIIRPNLLISGPLLYVLASCVFSTYISGKSTIPSPCTMINYAAVLNCLGSADSDTVYYALLLIQATSKKRHTSLHIAEKTEEILSNIPPFERESDEEEEVFEEELFEEISPAIEIPEPGTQIDIYGSLLSFLSEEHPYRLKQEAVCTLAFLVQCETASFSDSIPLEPCVEALIDGISGGGADATAALVFRTFCFLRDTMIMQGRREEIESLYESAGIEGVINEYQSTDLEGLRVALDTFDFVDPELGDFERQRAFAREELANIRKEYGIVDDD